MIPKMISFNVILYNKSLNVPTYMTESTDLVSTSVPFY